MRLAALGASAGFLAARLLWVALQPLLTAPALTRSNYRGRTLVTAAGVVLPLALLLVEGVRVAAGALGTGPSSTVGGARLLALVAAWGFGSLGLIDDLFGAGHERGFRGHLYELRRGRLTTGGLKLVGGGAVALVVVSPVSAEPSGRLVLDAALVALCANLGNLLDRRPGRVTKSALVACVLLLVTTAAAREALPAAIVVGAAIGLLRDDLHEHLMLGDAGANVLGAILGLATVLACSPDTRMVLFAAVVLLNLLAEVVSFSDVIDRLPPLRYLDQLGRRV